MSSPYSYKSPRSVCANCGGRIIKLSDKPIRHKSKMHHTSGFDTRESALESTKQLAEQVKENAIGDVRFELAGDIEWDGDGIPAMVAFFG